MKTILSKICIERKDFTSKPTEWGKTNEPLARQAYIKENSKNHIKVSVIESGLFISCDNPIFGASPDGIVTCECHENRILEIKCPWTHRDKSVKDYANLKESCLEIKIMKYN